MDKELNTDKKSDYIAYLGLIEGIVNRMSTVSATFKGFAIALFAGMLAFICTQEMQHFILIFVLGMLAILAVAAFDVWYLKMEKEYRRFYEDVRNWKRPIDFSLDLPSGLKIPIFDCIASKSIWPFYLILLIVYSVMSLFAI